MREQGEEMGTITWGRMMEMKWGGENKMKD